MENKSNFVASIIKLAEVSYKLHIMNLLIDSTEFKTDKGLNKEDITFIKDLGKNNLIELHIPWFVYQECLSTNINDLSIELNRIKNTLISFNRKGLAEQEYQRSKSIALQIDNLIQNIKTSCENLWSEFVTISNATLYEYDEKESNDVFKNYFEGGKPFKSLKNRKDIPDAFIYLTIKRISSTEKLHLISNDKNLTDKCVDDSNIIIHKTLKEFFKHSDFLEIDEKYQELKEVEKIEKTKNIILYNHNNFEDAVQKYTSRISYLTFEDPNLKSDNNEATIYAIDDVKTTILKENIKFIGNEVFVPIEVEGEASIDYAVYKPDYWIYDDLPLPSEDLNRHYYLLEDVVTLKMKKTLTFEMDKINEEEDIDVEIDEFDEIKMK